MIIYATYIHSTGSICTYCAFSQFNDIIRFGVPQETLNSSLQMYSTMVNN